MALTIKQQNFCNGIVSGLSAKDAYKAAYNTNAKDITISTEATKLLARADIQEYIETLNKPLKLKAQSEALSDREKKRQFLWDVIQNESQDMNNRLRAVDLLNKMDAEYININKNIDESANTLTALDTDTLKQLLQ